MRFLIVGSHPCASDSSSKLVHALSSKLCKVHDVAIYSDHRRSIDTDRHRTASKDIQLMDACAENLATSVVRASPDSVLCVGDVQRVQATLDVCKSIPVVAYLQLHYNEVKPCQVQILNRCKSVVVSSPASACSLLSAGVSVSVNVIPYGVDKELIYPIPKELARKVYHISKDHFVVLNINKNNIRKRWDVCMMAWARVVSNYHIHKSGKFPLLIIAAAMTGAWDLAYIYNAALQKLDIPFHVGLSHLIHIDTRCKLSDYSVNVLYNAADVGLSIGEAEAVGLSAKEHSSVGRTVVVSNVKGHTDNIRPDAARFIDSNCEYVLDTHRQDSGGVARLVSATSVARELNDLCNDDDGKHLMDANALYHSQPGWSGPCGDIQAILES